MQLLKRDMVATALVAIAGVLYGLWAVDSAPWGMSTRVTATQRTAAPPPSERKEAA